MLRKIIKIDEERCNGCGACAAACHEGAIEMVNGKARLTREDYCDGLGDCLPACPADAIAFEIREAPAYDEEAVMQAKAEKNGAQGGQGTKAAKLKESTALGCPGMRAAKFRENVGTDSGEVKPVASQLSQWPVQIKLAPVKTQFFHNADLLIAADCTAFVYGDFHNEFIKGRITLVGCPKLDGVDYAEKLTQILAVNEIRSITLVRMEVPCCGGLENAVKRAILASGRIVPWQVVTISTDGRKV